MPCSNQEGFFKGLEYGTRRQNAGLATLAAFQYQMLENPQNSTQRRIGGTFCLASQSACSDGTFDRLSATWDSSPSALWFLEDLTNLLWHHKRTRAHFGAHGNAGHKESLARPDHFPQWPTRCSRKVHQRGPKQHSPLTLFLPSDLHHKYIGFGQPSRLTELFVGFGMPTSCGSASFWNILGLWCLARSSGHGCTGINQRGFLLKFLHPRYLPLQSCRNGLCIKKCYGVGEREMRN